jgi:alcohol dehydrogenase class IV
MDALTHNVESYLSPAYHPLCDGIALEGVRIAARALPIAFRDGRDLAARGDMLMSSMMGAIAFQKDLGAVHSCAHALATVADLHHGLANGIMIDHVMRFNLPAATADTESPRRGGAAQEARAARHSVRRELRRDRHPGEALWPSRVAKADPRAGRGRVPTRQDQPGARAKIGLRFLSVGRLMAL